MLLPNRDNETGVDLMVVVAPDVPQSLFLDETYIQRILMNLLSNALKFTASGYILLLVEIDGGNLVATINDTGCGIPKSFLPELFEPFKQAQTRGKQRGTGLGLSIIKQLLHKMQGSIEVDSKYVGDPGVQPEQGGSTFTITVPVSFESSCQGSLPEAFPPKVAIFSKDPKSRSLEGLVMAWRKFGYEPVIVREICDLRNTEWSFVWVDFWHLQQDTTLLNQLARREDYVVLIPFDDQEMLRRHSKITSITHFVPLPKPLLWNSFEQRITTSRNLANKPQLAKGVRFAANVDALDDGSEKTIQKAPYVKRGVVLLVEDNPVCKFHFCLVSLC